MIPAFIWKTIEHYAAAATRFVAGYSLESYLADEKTRAAVERALEICGEALRKLDQLEPALAKQIPHARDIIGFRNILAHGYAELDHAKVYSIVLSHAPELLMAVRELLKGFPEPGTD